VKLRVDIELLELEHDAARADILEITKSMRELESEGGQEAQEQAKQLAKLELSFTGDREALKMFSDKENEKKIQDFLNTKLKDEIIKTKASRDRKRNDYAKQAAALAEKRLELAEVEKRYNETR